MKYIVYYRVSTKGQGESGLGLEAQRSIIRHFVPEGSIAGEYQETISAKVAPMERPQLAQALKECKEKGYGLAVAKVDRLSRVTEDALAVYSQLNGFLYSADIPMQLESVMDKFTLTIYMAIADRERELIGIRTKAALAEIKKKQEKGESRLNKKGEIAQPIGSPENLSAQAMKKGYQARKQNAMTNAAWVKAGEYAQLLREKGLALAAIATRLNEKGYTTRRGCQYQPATVQRLLAKFA
jgi:DNA invertase Pin-like site-specific DNA recombinase